MVNSYYSQDYAILQFSSYEFYYGYEVEVERLPEDTDIMDCWCFQVKKDEEILFQIPTREIREKVESDTLETMQDFLIAGMGLWLEGNLDQ